MYFQFTGQPGHGKSVLAIERALKMRDDHVKHQQECRAKGKEVPPDRTLYVCNVRDFDYAAAGAVPLTPDELRTWADHPEYIAKVEEITQYLRSQPMPERMFAERLEQALESPEVLRLANEKINPAFENAIILVDEAYEHKMFPKRSPSTKVPRHVERVAKHRHFGIDFIMICQSPKRQMDDFLHDLIEEHYHVRRRFGLPFVHVKRWDKFEPYPDKALALTVSRRKYPTHIFKLYTSTKFDTSTSRVPWFFPAAAALLLAIVVGAYFTVASVRAKFTPAAHAATPKSAPPAGAPAAAGAQQGGAPAPEKWATATDYARAHLPRFGTMPWTAPVFDQRSLTADPQVFCMSSSPGSDANEEEQDYSCTCYTEQATVYDMTQPECRRIARHGSIYNPYRQRESQPPREPPQATAGAGRAHAPVAMTLPGDVADVGITSNVVKAPAAHF